MKGEFLLEIGTEEIPAGFIPEALDELKARFANELRRLSVLPMERELYDQVRIEAYGTPRRLILHAVGLPERQRPAEVFVYEQLASHLRDEHGNPTKAAKNFAAKQRMSVQDVLDQVPASGITTSPLVIWNKGQPTVQILAEVVPGLLQKLPFPKTMRWMDLDVRFARPVHWIVALFDGQVVPFSFGNVRSGDTSVGHRFVGSPITSVRSLEGLRTSLQAQGVIIDPALRREEISARIRDIAAREGLHIYEDAELLEEITYLVESPHPVMGSFAEDFLELPASILRTCMKKHQRYFSVQDADGRITNRFIAVNNTPVKDPQFSVKGHERVIRARLEDARFYFREDRKKPLFDRLEDLKGVVFHSKLGTSYEKVERFTRLSQMLAERLAPEMMREVQRAALLSKCDLATGIVYEFPELQGVIGSYYAKMDGEPEDVATAIREHYLPAHAGDILPKGDIGALVSVADRIDTIVGCFSVGLIPTGAADPYALRRHALGIIQILINLDRPLDLRWLVREALILLDEWRTRPAEEVEPDVMEFIRTRFVYFHTSRDFPLDVVEAAVRCRFDDAVDARRRVEALNEWKQREDFDAIMIGFKRVVNILKAAESFQVSEELFAEEAEKQLFSAFKDVEGRAEPLIASGNYAKTLEIMAELKAPIDRFFDLVMVMVEDERLRSNRLGLLQRIASLFGKVADFSFIGSTADGK